MVWKERMVDKLVKRWINSPWNRWSRMRRATLMGGTNRVRLSSQMLKLNLLFKHSEFMCMLLFSFGSLKPEVGIKLSLFSIFLCLDLQSMFHPWLTKGGGKVLDMAVHRLLLLATCMTDRRWLRLNTWSRWHRLVGGGWERSEDGAWFVIVLGILRSWWARSLNWYLVVIIYGLEHQNII
jgi:hypothetical protein